MSNLLDDVSRIIASPVSRRKAFRLVGGAALGAVGLGSATRLWADNCTPSSPTVCGNTPSGKLRCCQTGETCCNNANCCSSNQHCCGTKCCQPNQACCTVNGFPQCCDATCTKCN